MDDKLKKEIEYAVQACITGLLGCDPLKDIYECRSYYKAMNEYEKGFDQELSDKILDYEDAYLKKLINALNRGDVTF